MWCTYLCRIQNAKERYKKCCLLILSILRLQRIKRLSTKNEKQTTNKPKPIAQLYCEVLKLAAKPSCLGGGEHETNPD